MLWKGSDGQALGWRRCRAWWSRLRTRPVASLAAVASLRLSVSPTPPPVRRAECEQPAPGAVLRINADGSVEPVVEGLFFPHGIAFDAVGNLFVTVNSIISGPDAPLGQVLRFDGIATPA